MGGPSFFFFPYLGATGPVGSGSSIKLENTRELVDAPPLL